MTHTNPNIRKTTMTKMTIMTQEAPMANEVGNADKAGKEGAEGEGELGMRPQRLFNKQERKVCSLLYVCMFNCEIY